MRQAQVWRYALPMDAGVVLRERRLKQRDGLLICLREGAHCGWGEITPLPGFSLETLEQAQAVALAWIALWLREQPAPLPDAPAVAFGLSCALAELAGELPEDADFRCAPLCAGDPDALFAALVATPGDKIAKMKVSLYEAVRDGLQASMLLEALPDLGLRLDANRAWTLEKARQFARYISPALRARIDFIEEPCQTRDASRQFAQETGIAIAWDESVREADFRIVAEPGLAALVIKPTLTGSLTQIHSLIGQAHAQGLTAVISSSLESSLGLTQLARIAAWLTPGTLPGLDTLSLMRAQLVRRWPGSALPCLETGALEVVL